jgi:hypothetical protein
MASADEERDKRMRRQKGGGLFKMNEMGWALLVAVTVATLL